GVDVLTGSGFSRTLSSGPRDGAAEEAFCRESKIRWARPGVPVDAGVRDRRGRDGHPSVRRGGRRLPVALQAEATRMGFVRIARLAGEALGESPERPRAK